MGTTSHREARARLRMAVAAAAALASMQVDAQQAPAEEPAFQVKGGVSYGVGVRTSDPSPELLFTHNASQVGLASSNTAGRNQDDGNMNYRKGDVFANVVKGFADLNGTHGRFSAALRVQGWHDAELADGRTPWGHTPNGLRADAPLSDDGARQRGKFSNVVLSNAWLRGRFDAWDVPLTATLGYQNIGWRGMGLAPGPLANLDPADIIARTRPGAFAEEGSIPIPALRLAARTRAGLDLDAFYQLGFRANQTPVCGTFFAAADRTLDGCDKTMVHAGAGTMSDRQLLAAHRVVTLGSIREPQGAGQFGLSVRGSSSRWKTDFGLSYARFHSRSSYTNMVKSGIPGANPFAPDDPRNPQTQVVYPKGIQVLALDFRRALQTATLYGSVGYSPNQPLAYPGGEVFQAFVAPVAGASLFRAQERATPAGGVFQGWDRRHASDWQLGVIQPLKGAMGAANMTLRAELNAKVVHDLPDPTQLRYGRPEVYGIGPIRGVCAAGASAKTCSNEGYVSRSAWGYTLQAIATYPQAIGPLALRPRIAVSHNVNGTSYDGSLREGRKSWLLGLDALWGATTLSLSLVRHGGGTYDNTNDRDYIAASVATRF